MRLVIVLFDPMWVMITEVLFEVLERLPLFLSSFALIDVRDDRIVPNPSWGNAIPPKVDGIPWGVNIFLTSFLG